MDMHSVLKIYLVIPSLLSILQSSKPFAPKDSKSTKFVTTLYSNSLFYTGKY